MPAADLATNEWTTLLAATFPFVVAIALLLISPLITAKVKTAVLGRIAEEAVKLGVPEDEIPPHLRRESVDAYIEYAMDAVQIVPLTLLPVTGAVFAIAAHVPGPIALGYLGIAILAAVAVEAWVLSQPAGRYASHRLIRYYSVVTATGMASNLLGLAMISYFGRFGGTKLIPEGVDLGVVAAFGLVICYVAVRLILPSHYVGPALLVQDLPFAGGVVRQLRYGQSELAVLDASAEVVTANWTAKVGLALFVSATDRIFGFDDDMRVVLSSVSDPEIELTMMSSLRDRLDDRSFEATCEFVRLDLSATQSAFWERLSNEDLAIAGFGDHTSTFTKGTERRVRRLLTKTATPAVNSDEVLRSFRALAQQYTDRERPHDTDVPE